MKTVLVDIDHTLSDAYWRDPEDNPMGKTDWDQYHQSSVYDDPFEHMIDLINLMHGPYHIVGLTTRPEKWRGITITWLVNHRVEMDDLLMRPNDCYLHIPESKLATVERSFKSLSEIHLLIDDNENVVKKFQEEGIPCLQVHGRRHAKP